MTPHRTTQEILRAVEDARAYAHPMRAMRVTLECGHMRLMPHVNTVMGIGAETACKICTGDGAQVVRTVVNIEETGVLHDDWIRGTS